MIGKHLPPMRRLGSSALARVIAAAGLLLAAAQPNAAAWELAHGDAGNTGFVDIITAPAGSGSRTVPGLGHFALGAGPVVAPDGTVYLGTVEGKLIALHADGSAFWSRDIAPGLAIVASPAVGADGSIYVIGVRQFTDAQGYTAYESVLNKFDSGGGWMWQAPFPSHEGGTLVGQPFTDAPPNIWRQNGVDFIIVPVVYRGGRGAYDLRLLAFTSGAGGVVDETRVTFVAAKTTGGGAFEEWWLGAALCLDPLTWIACLHPPTFEPPAGEATAKPPLPGVAIVGSTIVVADNQHDIVGYHFTPAAGFNEAFRLHDEAHLMTSPPTALKDQHSVVGTADSLTAGAVAFAGPNAEELPTVGSLGPIFAAPTLLADGRFVVVQAKGRGAAVFRGLRATKFPLPGDSIVSAAASRNLLYISTSDAFVTYDSATMQEVSRVDWVGGGISPPAIGPRGFVYAIASNTLFVFPFAEWREMPEGCAVCGPEAKPAETTDGSAQEQDAASAASQIFKPPLTEGGQRLYACADLDGKVCGAPVATSFCRQQGFTQAAEIEVQRKGVQAATLNGELCDKKKCRVFEVIVCNN